MRKCIKEINNYSASNPFIDREPLKNKFMRMMFLIYKKYRIFISKLCPLSNWQKYIWFESDNMFFDKKDTNAAVICIDGSEDNKNQPFFNIEYLFIMELIPKEQMSDVMKGIEKFRTKHSEKSIFDINGGGNTEYFKKFFNDKAFSHLKSFSIKKIVN